MLCFLIFSAWFCGLWGWSTQSNKWRSMHINVEHLNHSSVAGLVQGPGSGFWPGHRVGRVNLYFKKNSKRRRFSKKKNNSQRVATGFLTGFCRVNPPGRPGHIKSWLILFFHQPDPIPTPGRPGRAGLSFKTMIWTFKENFFLPVNIIITT
jgi:hypothetical protein